VNNDCGRKGDRVQGEGAHVEFFEDGGDVGLRGDAGEDAQFEFADEGRVGRVDEEVEQERLKHGLVLFIINKLKKQNKNKK
jgi:hypothetical protein